MAALFPCPLAEWASQYTPQEQAWFKTEEGNFLLGGWWKFSDGCIAIPESLAPTFVKQFHEGTHSGQTALETTLAQHFYVPKLSSIRRQNVRDVSYVPKITPGKGQECSQAQKVELLLKTWLWISVKYHEFKDASIYWYLSAPSQDGWKTSPLRLIRPRR
jgi:hypothetical protein